MKVKQLLKSIPFAVPVKQRADRAQTYIFNKLNIARLGKHPTARAEQLKEAVEAFQQEEAESGARWKERIEDERDHLLKCSEPVNDGRLGEGGLYDSNTTVREACSASKPPGPALFIFLLIRATRPNRVIELGTNVGISSAYIGAGLKENGQNGRVLTLDASPYRQALAKEVHREIGLDNIAYINGLFADTLEPALQNLGSVDLAFIDGHHQYQPTLDYFDTIVEFSAANTVFVFDDIRWSDGMKKAWSDLRRDERLGLVVDLDSMGLCVRREQGVSKRTVLDPIRLF